MTVSFDTIAGLNVDQSGAPYLNLSKVDLLNLNYDQNGVPFLGVVQSVATASVQIAATMAQPGVTVAALTGETAQVAASLPRPTISVQARQADPVLVTMTMARPGATVAAIIGEAVQVAASLPRPTVSVQARQADPVLVTMTMARPGATVAAVIGEAAQVAASLPQPAAIILAEVVTTAPINATIAATLPGPTTTPFNFTNWSAGDKTGNIIVTDRGQVATVVGPGQAGIRTDVGILQSAEACYVEMVVTNPSANARIGGSHLVFDLNDGLGNDYSLVSFGIDTAGNVWNGDPTYPYESGAPTWGSGDLLMLAVWAGGFWFGVNGVWGFPFLTPQGPEAPFETNNPLGFQDNSADPLYLTYTDTDAAGASIVFHTSAATCTYPVPWNTTAWDVFNPVTGWNPADTVGLPFTFYNGNSLLWFVASGTPMTGALRAINPVNSGLKYFVLDGNLSDADTWQAGLATADYDISYSGGLGHDPAGESIGWDVFGNVYQAGNVIGACGSLTFQVPWYTHTSRSGEYRVVVDFDTSQLWVGVNGSGGTSPLGVPWILSSTPYDSAHLVPINLHGKAWHIASSTTIGSQGYFTVNVLTASRDIISNRPVATAIPWDNQFVRQQPGFILAEGVSLSASTTLASPSMAASAATAPVYPATVAATLPGPTVTIPVLLGVISTISATLPSPAAVVPVKQGVAVAPTVSLAAPLSATEVVEGVIGHVTATFARPRYIVNITPSAQALVAATLARPSVGIASRVGDRLAVSATLSRPSVAISVLRVPTVQIGVTLPAPRTTIDTATGTRSSLHVTLARPVLHGQVWQADFAAIAVVFPRPDEAVQATYFHGGTGVRTTRGDLATSRRLHPADGSRIASLRQRNNLVGSS